MSELLKRKIDEQNRLWTRMQEIQRVAVDESRDWTAEERANWDKANADIDVVSADIERLEKLAKVEKIDYRQVIEGQGTGEPPAERTEEERDAAYGEAFSRYMRGGTDNMSAEQRQLLLANKADSRAYQGVGTPSLGGYLVPEGFRATMTETLKAFGGLMQHANVITTSTGNSLQWPTNDDTANVGAILAENTIITEQEATFGTRNLGAFTYTSKLVRVSIQLMQDSAFDMDSWLPRKLGERIGRAVAADLVTGTGVGEPEGLLTNSTEGATVTLTNWDDLDGGFVYGALIDLEHSVDPAYRGMGNCRFVLNDTTLSEIRKQTDTQLRPLWLPVPVAGMPATINGNPYTIDQGMPSPADGAKSVMYGDIRAGLVVRQVLDVQMVRLAERYADYLQVGFFGFSRLDAVPDDTSAVKHLNIEN
jgi:HK97 family phage major capsid protein